MKKMKNLRFLLNFNTMEAKPILLTLQPTFSSRSFLHALARLKKTDELSCCNRTQDIKNMRIRPQNPQRRVIAQKSVFLHPPEGFIDVSDNQIVIIPSTLKEKFLKYLRKHHGIFTETIYNDIHGFIRNQNIQRNAYIQFNLGLTFQYKGYHAEPSAEKQQAYKDAISHYDQAIELNPEDYAAYGNRGECWLHLSVSQSVGTNSLLIRNW